MKTSNRIVLIVVAAVLAVMVVSIVGLRLYLDSVLGKSDGVSTGQRISGSRELVSESYDVRDFTRLRFAGGWTVRVSEGEEYSLEIEAQERYMNILQVEKNGEELNVEARSVLDFEGAPMRARVVMPELEGVRSLGGIELKLLGFSGEKLEVDCKGGSAIEGRGGGYERMELRFSGGTELKFRELPAEDVDIRSTGAIDAQLTMRGGELTGKLSGAGSIAYYGTVSRQAIDTQGVTEVKALEK